MRRVSLATLICLVAVLAASAAPTAKREVTYDLTGWRTLDMSSDLITASGGAPLATSSDGSLRLSASRIILRLTKTKGRQGISTAEAVGGVKLHALQAPGQDMDAVCDKAVVNPSLHRAELTGSVRVRRWDKAKFSGPVELTGDAVTMDLKNGRVVATSHTSKSHFSATPKSGGKP